MKTLTIVIPAYNEEKRLAKTKRALMKVIPGRGRAYKLAEIIFVNDGSNDNTLEVLNTIQKDLKRKHRVPVTVISYRKNRGKGYAVKRGLLASKSDYTLFFDVDMATPLTELKKFLPLMKKGSDVIIGTRKNGESTVKVHQPLYREYMGKVWTILASIILNTWLTDFTCGFKMFSKQAKRDVFRKARINRWSYDAEILYLSNKYGYKIEEVAVLWKDDNRTRVNLIKDVYRSLSELIQIRLFDLLDYYATRRVYRPAFTRA